MIKSRKEILFEISQFVIKAFVFAFSAVADNLITNQIDQFVQTSQSRLAKYFHELMTQQQENYQANVKENKRKKSKSSKSLKEYLK
jgi:hypothetical protein